MKEVLEVSLRKYPHSGDKPDIMGMMGKGVEEFF
jgi:hypothetical protein